MIKNLELTSTETRLLQESIVTRQRRVEELIQTFCDTDDELVKYYMDERVGLDGLMLKLNRSIG